MFKPEPRFFSSPGIIGIYAAGAKILVGILNASCWLVHSAAPSCPTCFWPARSFTEEAASHHEIGTSEYPGIMLSHTWVTGQGYCFILLLRGPIRKRWVLQCTQTLQDRGSCGLWVWCRADQLHVAHRITEERGQMSASMKQRVIPAMVGPHTQPVVWGGCWELQRAADK